MQEHILNEKYDKLKSYLKSLGSVAVAFSGGVDSTFLLKVAHDVLGSNAVAITAKTYSLPKREMQAAADFCKNNNIKHIILEYNELEVDGFAKNPVNRCYYCKRESFGRMLRTAADLGISCVVEGTNADDVGDYRPGMKAVAELDIVSPLKAVGLTKNEIRVISKELGLSVWNKPSSACLASRFVYGEIITKEKLEMADRAEQLLLDMGFIRVRVRIHSNLARIEVDPEEFEKLVQKDIREKIVKAFKSYGFSYVTMDMQGYRIGSMNETIKQ